MRQPDKTLPSVFPFRAIAKRFVRGSVREQVVTVTDVDPEKRIYEFDYGVMSFHEGFAEEHELRLLTKDEEQQSVWELPQQFYQSGPPGVESMDLLLV